MFARLSIPEAIDYYRSLRSRYVSLTLAPFTQECSSDSFNNLSHIIGPFRYSCTGKHGLPRRRSVAAYNHNYRHLTSPNEFEKFARLPEGRYLDRQLNSTRGIGGGGRIISRGARDSNVKWERFVDSRKYSGKMINHRAGHYEWQHRSFASLIVHG